MIDSKFKIKKFVKLLGQIWFFSYSILILYLIFSTEKVGVKSILKCMLPITYSEYWFLTTYILLYLLSNFINKFLNNITKKEYEVIMMILLLIWSIIPTLILGKIEFSNIDWFILVYLIGAYLKKYRIKYFENQKRNIVILSSFVFVGIITIFILDKLYDRLGFNPLHFTLPMNQIICLAISIYLFVIFKNISIKDNKTVNKIASCTLGVYLIHGHILARDIIWYNVYNITEFTNSKYLVIYEIFVVVTLYIFCVFIDFIRQNTVEKLYMKFIDRIEEKYGGKIKKVISKFKEEGDLT